MGNSNHIEKIREKLRQPGNINDKDILDIRNLLSELEIDEANNIIKLFPEIAKFAINAIDEIKVVTNEVIVSDEKSNIEYYKHSKEALETFKAVYQDKNATIEEKKNAAENIQKVLERDDNKDDKIAENNMKILKNITGVAFLALGVVLVAYGAKISIKPSDIRI